jgi:hypothetical protein
MTRRAQNDTEAQTKLCDWEYPQTDKEINQPVVLNEAEVHMCVIMKEFGSIRGSLDRTHELDATNGLRKHQDEDPGESRRNRSGIVRLYN